MDVLFAVFGFVAVAAITPGPNNFIVMGAAARAGLGAALPAIAGVVIGTLALLTLVWAGGGVAFDAEPRLRSALRLAGCLCLIWFGAIFIWQSSDSDNRSTASMTRNLPRSALGIAAFQFLNPKGWVMVFTATAATSGSTEGVWSLAALAAIFTAVTSVCLTLWALVGSTIAVMLKESRARRWFDRAMGGLLIGSAALLLV